MLERIVSEVCGSGLLLFGSQAFQKQQKWSLSAAPSSNNGKRASIAQQKDYRTNLLEALKAPMPSFFYSHSDEDVLKGILQTRLNKLCPRF